MSDKFKKFKDIFGVASKIAKPFVPGGAGSILEKVNEGLNGGNSSNSSVTAIKELATRVDEYNDQQDQAIIALHERLKKAGF